MNHKDVIIYPNLYYKKDGKGYGFAITDGIYKKTASLQGMDLCSSIDDLITKVFGNSTIFAWLGGVVYDAEGNSYYVFGHNEPKAQEQGKTRKSHYFTFIAFSFDSLSNLASLNQLQMLVDTIKKKNIEEWQNTVGYSFPPVDHSLSDNSSYLSDWMASYAVDPTYTVLSTAMSKSECEFDISYLMNYALFPDKTPVIVYQERNDIDASDAKPHSCWSFQASGSSVLSSKPKCIVTYHTPQEQYLREVISVLCQKNAYREVFLSYYTAERKKLLKEESGSSNVNLFYHIVCWKFALDNGFEVLLPTKEQKDAILKKLHYS